MTKKEEAALRAAITDFHWMARRYVDGRRSYAVGLFNRHVQDLLDLGFKFKDVDEGIWAYHGDTKAREL